MSLIKAIRKVSPSLKATPIRASLFASSFSNIAYAQRALAVHTPLISKCQALNYRYFSNDKTTGSSSQDSTKQVIKPGLDKAIIKQGDGKTFPTKGSKVSAHYVGKFLDGKEFDSSRARKEPFVFQIGRGQVIKGWDEGIMTMSVGERATLYCSPEFAYGREGIRGAIPPNSTLVFDVELLGVK